MTIWLEFPPAQLQAVKSAYLEKMAGAEAVQDEPIIDATGTRALIGSSRIDLAKASELSIGNAPWLVIHTVFPVDWDWKQA